MKEKLKKINKVRMTILFGVVIAMVTGITVISAQIQDNPASPTQACHIYPIRNPKQEVYPASVNVLHTRDALAGGCFAACQGCNTILPDGVCIDHYGCGCEQWFTMKCKGKPTRVMQ